MRQVYPPVPCISVSLAPPEPLKYTEYQSPFEVHLPKEPDSPRPQHLAPPPALSPNQFLGCQRQSQLSPLSPPHPSGGKGMERARFEAMLQASKERSAMVGAKKPVELRKEIAVKAQQAKQLQRRAQFLNKLAAPPSPSATDLPVTPPESPAIFHFSLPSPGLESPLELLEDLLDHPERYENTTRVEQVDFRLPHQKLEEDDYRRHFASANRCSGLLPSLDQISQRMQKAPLSSTGPSPSIEQGAKGNCRLPPFLRNRTPSPTPEATRSLTGRAPRRPRRVPPRLALGTVTPSANVIVQSPTGATFPQPPSPKSLPRIKLQITTTVCLPSRSKSSPTEFTEVDIIQLGSEQSGMGSKPTESITTTTVNQHIPSRRAQVTKDMFNKLSRRTPGFPKAAACGIRAHDDISLARVEEVEDKLRRRISAPAEMPVAQRGVSHPVLSKAGGF